MSAVNKPPREKRACSHCGTQKFGLIRYPWFGEVYCSKKCFEAAEMMRNRVREFLRFLKA